MRVVVDLGCKSYADHSSVAILVERFRPALLYGFDPHPEQGEGIERTSDTVVVYRRAAAWTHGGRLTFTFDGTRSHHTPDSPDDVECFDFPAWLAVLPPCKLVVKMDVEGAEYTLLKQLQGLGLDERIDLLLAEWHQNPPSFPLRCPIEPWDS